MKIIVLSDSHGDKETVKSVSALPADAIIHCGDSELVYDDPILHKIHVVRGNCDRDQRFPSAVVTEIKGKTIYAVHGHEHDVNRSLMSLYYHAKEQNADIALFGHTHRYGAEMQDGILFLNPGSTLLPRGGNEATYAVVEWLDSVQVTFKNLKHEIVDFIEFKIF